MQKFTCFKGKHLKKRMWLGLTAVCLIIGFTTAAFAGQDSTKTAIEEGKGLYYNCRRMFYNAVADMEKTKSMLRKAGDLFQNLPEGYDKAYWEAQIQFLRAEIAEAAKEGRNAATGFTESSNLAQKALQFNKKSSDATRLLADCYMRLMKYNANLYQMKYGPESLKLAETAVKLDNQNYPAYNSLGSYYVNAPAIGGGNVDKAVVALKKALESKDEFDNFISNVWLGVAFEKKKAPAEAKKYFERALQIYPQSPWAKNFLDGLEKK